MIRGHVLAAQAMPVPLDKEIAADIALLRAQQKIVNDAEAKLAVASGKAVDRSGVRGARGGAGGAGARGGGGLRGPRVEVFCAQEFLVRRAIVILPSGASVAGDDG